MIVNENVVNFLLDNSDVAIRYRVKRDLCENTDVNELNKVQNELVDSKRVIHLLDCLKNHKEYHGATLYAVENSLNMQMKKAFSIIPKIILQKRILAGY